jgi:N-acetylglutamate synthase-like GNAT family acetyltransferase
MTPNLRKAQESDLPRIFELLAQANMHHIPSEEMPELTFVNYTVAEIGGTVVGFCGYKILSPTLAKTELMVVDTSRRGSGVGILLQNHRMQEMFVLGIKRLTTNTDSPSSIAWYIKHFCYREIGKLKKVHEFGDPTVHEWTSLEADLVQWQAMAKSLREKGV